jgi:hypothetical protein
VEHSITGYICDAPSVSHNTPHIGICKDTEVRITINDTSGTPSTTIKFGALTTNGTDFVTGVITGQSKYDSVSQNGLDTDRMTLEACVDASTHAVCQPAP